MNWYVDMRYIIKTIMVVMQDRCCDILSMGTSKGVDGGNCPHGMPTVMFAQLQLLSCMRSWPSTQLYTSADNIQISSYFIVSRQSKELFAI